MGITAVLLRIPMRTFSGIFTRASITASDSVSSNTSHCGSGGGGVSLSGRRVPEQSRCLIPQDGYLLFEPSVSSPKPLSCLESTRASLTVRDGANASTSYLGSDGGGLSPSGNQVTEKSGGLFPQYGYLPFESSVRSPKPPSCLDSARSSLAASNSARANTSHR